MKIKFRYVLALLFLALAPQPVYASDVLDDDMLIKVCRAAMASARELSLDIMKGTVKADGASRYALIEYERPGDGFSWEYGCKQEGTRLKFAAPYRGNFISWDNGIGGKTHDWQLQDDEILIIQDKDENKRIVNVYPLSDF